MSARGHRLLGGAWALALGLGLAATAFAGEVAGHFGGGRVLLRPWMVGYNSALGSLQLSALALLAAGALQLPSGRARGVALAAFALAAGAVAVFLPFPLLWPGPWAPDGLEVRWLRLLVFAPSALRAVGCIAISVALFRSHAASYVICALLVVDLFLVAWSWWSTPRAVMLCVHPYCVAPWGLVPWIAASAIFFWLLLSPAATRT